METIISIRVCVGVGVWGGVRMCVLCVCVGVCLYVWVGGWVGACVIGKNIALRYLREVNKIVNCFKFDKILYPITFIDIIISNS